MGIYDRDYMRRRREDDDARYAATPGEAKANGWLARFFGRYPRFGLWLAAALGVLILAAAIYGRLSR